MRFELWLKSVVLGPPIPFGLMCKRDDTVSELGEALVMRLVARISIFPYFLGHETKVSNGLPARGQFLHHPSFLQVYLATVFIGLRFNLCFLVHW